MRPAAVAPLFGGVLKMPVVGGTLAPFLERTAARGGQGLGLGI